MTLFPAFLRARVARLASRVGLHPERPTYPAVEPEAVDLFGQSRRDLPPTARLTTAPVKPLNPQPDAQWEQKIKQARRLIAGNSRTEAAELLDGVEEVVEAFVQRGTQAAALCCLIMTDREQEAAELINRIYATPGWFSIVYYSGSQNQPGRFVWDVKNQDSSVLSINRHIQGFKNEFFLLDRLMSTLPVLARYRLQPSKAVASTVLHVGDSAVSTGIGFCSNRDDVFLIPDGVFLRLESYRATRVAFASNPVEWQARKPVCFWRGGTTGQMTNRSIGWRTLPRIKLCELALSSPDLMDFGITSIGQMPDANYIREIELSGLTKLFVPPADFINYKYHVDIDGNTNSWPGLFQKLLTGSVVLKVESSGKYRQWYYDRLVPWRNFVPVSSDMSDLIERLKWLKSNDDKARAIGAEGKKLAESLTYEGEIEASRTAIAKAFEASRSSTSI